MLGRFQFKLCPDAEEKDGVKFRCVQKREWEMDLGLTWILAWIRAVLDRFQKFKNYFRIQIEPLTDDNKLVQH